MEIVNFRRIAILVILVLSICACSQDEDINGESQVLVVPEPRTGNVTSNSIEFVWDSINNAKSYCYIFYDANENILVQSATKRNSVVFPNLDSAAKYKFMVKAEAQDSRYDSDYCVLIEATTLEEGTVDPNPGNPPLEKLGFPANENDNLVRAFPGAEGAGMFTTGGRGGRVIKVTNLNDSGSGSLRAAIEASGARTVVFEVAGVIELRSDLRIRNGNITIAGQTAPGDGICLKNRSLNIDADNVIIRFIRSRPGESANSDNLDAMWGRYHKNIIIDHCSMSWSTDECASFYANKNFTMQWCILTESLHNSGHTKGSHGYGGIWGGAPASFHHNLLSNHDSRNPRFDSPNTYSPYDKSSDINVNDRVVDFRNNVIYNFCNYPAYGGEGMKMNFVGNTYKWGPASIYGSGKSYNSSGQEQANKICKREYFYNVDGVYTTGGQSYDLGAAHIYYGDNTNCFDSSVDSESSVGANLSSNNKLGFVINNKTVSSVKPNITWESSPLAIKDGSKACYVTTHASDVAFEKIVDYAGASKRRDAVDLRAVTTAKNGTFYKNGSVGSQNGIIDLPSDVDGYPVYMASQTDINALKDTDNDGIPDAWEDEFGLDKNNGNDGNSYMLDSRYTNIESYLHFLVKDIVNGQISSGDYVQLN